MTKIKIRGIYATALTKLFMDQELDVVQPSTAISKRFDMDLKPARGEILIKDREDKQGISVTGTAEASEPVIKILRGLPDITIREKNPLEWLAKGKDQKRIQIFPGFTSYDVEFPALSKLQLDKIRDRIMPTVTGHHRFKIFASKLVEDAECELQISPVRREEIELRLWRFLCTQLRNNAIVGIEHSRPNGKVLQLREGSIIDFIPETRALRLARRFKGGGSYDGLSAAREEGDYGISTFIEGGWSVHHAYYSKSNELKGEYYNINTPVEFYPDRIRYVDLEVDVVADKGEVSVVDCEKLEEAVEQGYISKSLSEKAMEIAGEIIEKIKN